MRTQHSDRRFGYILNKERGWKSEEDKKGKAHTLDFLLNNSCGWLVAVPTHSIITFTHNIPKNSFRRRVLEGLPLASLAFRIALRVTKAVAGLEQARTT